MKLCRLSTFALILAFVFAGCRSTQQSTYALPRSTPEAEGISSQAIIDFVDGANQISTEFHSFMVLRHGKVVAEGWWDPYRPELKHTMYSTSKSFTSTAVGFTVSEGLMTVNDKVVSFFPDELPDSISPDLAKMEVRHLLFMSAGQDPEPTFKVVSEDDDWIKGFLAAPVVHEPGTVFLYNSLASYMLSAIVQKVTGQKVADYLKPRLFDPLGIEGYDWEVDPKGINTGGWGLRIKTEDMAKFGQLLLQKGKWNGEQIIPEAWVNEATTAKIDQNPNATAEERKDNSWLQGYAYQFWRCRHNAFRADGAYGQYIIVLPDQDVVVAIQAESPNMQEEINQVWEYILPGIQNTALPANPDKLAELEQKLNNLALPIPPECANNEQIDQLIGSSYQMDENPVNWESLAFAKDDQNQLKVTIKTSEGEYPISFGAGVWAYAETPMLGPNLLLGAKAHYQGIGPDKIAAAYTCNNENLKLVLRYIETPHTETINCSFDGDKINVDVEYSQSPGAVPPFTGTRSK